MITKTEAERLAAAAHALRPDWPVPSLVTFLAGQKDRAYRDVAVALAWVATDPATKTPARLLEAGPWWRATQSQGGTFVAADMRCPEHPTQPAGHCRTCAQAAADVDHARHADAARLIAREQLEAERAEVQAYFAVVRARRAEQDALKAKAEASA